MPARNRINVLKVRRSWGTSEWFPPIPYSEDSWLMQARDHMASIMVSVFDAPSRPGNGAIEIEWIHASISRVDRMPDYDDLARLHRSVWGEAGWAYQFFVPKSEHINFTEHALHLWGRRDGKPVLPNFGKAGTI